MTNRNTIVRNDFADFATPQTSITFLPNKTYRQTPCLAVKPKGELHWKEETTGGQGK